MGCGKRMERECKKELLVTRGECPGEDTKKILRSFQYCVFETEVINQKDLLQEPFI